MRRLLALAILPLLFVATHAQTSLVIRDVTVLDMTGSKPKARMTVVVEGNRIARIGRGLRPPENATIVDGRGKFLIPGLWDMHVHALRPDRADYFFSLFIANGVTGIRDMGTTAEGFEMLGRLRNEIASGKSVGPRIIAAGRIMDGARPSVPPNSIPFSGEAEARAQVRYLKRSGADFIKVYDGVSPEEGLGKFWLWKFNVGQFTGRRRQAAGPYLYRGVDRWRRRDVFRVRSNRICGGRHSGGVSVERI